MNGFTEKQMRDWKRACRYAARFLARKWNVEWHDDRFSVEYMYLRNGYLAGYRAGRAARSASEG